MRLTIVEMREQLIECMKENDFDQEDIDVIANDIKVFAWVEHCLMDNVNDDEKPSIKQLFCDPGFVEGLEYAPTEPMTFEDTVKAIEENKTSLWEDRKHLFTFNHELMKRAYVTALIMMNTFTDEIPTVLEKHNVIDEFLIDFSKIYNYTFTDEQWEDLESYDENDFYNKQSKVQDDMEDFLIDLMHKNPERLTDPML